MFALHRRHARQRRSEHWDEPSRFPLREILFAGGDKVITYGGPQNPRPQKRFQICFHLLGYRFITEEYCDAQGLSVPASRYVTR